MQIQALSWPTELGTLEGVQIQQSELSQALHMILMHTNFETPLA